MLKLIKTEKRKYDLLYYKGEIEHKTITNEDGTEEIILQPTGEAETVVKLDLIYSPVTNKFNKIAEFIENCSETMGSEFDNWFVGYLKDYINSGQDYAVIRDNLDTLQAFCDRYIDETGINFEDYINKSKASKNSIFFDDREIKKIVQVACYLKLYFFIAKDVNLKLSNKFHKETYNKLISKINDTDSVYKLFKIVFSKTYEYNYTDKYMWDYIQAIYCKTTDIHVFTIFNFLMNNILVTCDPRQNPIPYLISVIDESIKWILKNIYKDAIVYSDSISTQDVYTIQGKDNLTSYAHNDTIGKLLIIAYNQIETIGIDKIEQLKSTLGGLKEISLFANYVTYPILFKVLEVPYRHFMTLSVSNAYMLNILLYHFLPEEFKTRYPEITKMLLYYNKQKPILRTTYKIKNIAEFTSTLGTFLTFKNTVVPYDFYSSIIGKLSRNSYSSIITGKEITNFPLARLEKDIIHFYNDYFDNRLEPIFDQIREKIDQNL